MLTAKEVKPTSKKKTRLYNIWQGMKQRCNNPKCNRYQHYGAKGIKVCESWLNNFQEFAGWAYANGYSDDPPGDRAHSLSIDRIDPTKDYCPENCRWIPAGLNAALIQTKLRGVSEEQCVDRWNRFQRSAQRYSLKEYHTAYPARPTRNSMYINYFRALEKDV